MQTSLLLRASSDRFQGEASSQINVVLVYENLSAALWAAEILAGLLRQAADGDGLEPRLSPWNFSILEDPDLRADATAAAVQADLIVIATSSRTAALPVAVESWLEQSLVERRGAAAAVAALLGRANVPDGADSPRLQTVQRLAREAGCEFFAPCVTEAVLSVA